MVERTSKEVIEAWGFPDPKEKVKPKKGG